MHLLGGPQNFMCDLMQWKQSKEDKKSGISEVSSLLRWSVQYWKL